MRRLVPLTLTAAAAFAILVSLGVWQLHRLSWKTALLAQIDAAEAHPAIPWAPGLPDFAKVRIKGHWLPQQALFGSEVRGPTLGAQLVGVLQPDDGPAVVVDRGWIASLPPPPTGAAEVEGWMHPPAEPGWFTPADDPAARRFYTLDAQRIAAALGVGEVRPFVLVALGPAGQPDPARGLPRPPNDHLNYAFTWFGLAGALLGVYLVFVWKKVRGA